LIIFIRLGYICLFSFMFVFLVLNILSAWKHSPKHNGRRQASVHMAGTRPGDDGSNRIAGHGTFGRVDFQDSVSILLYKYIINYLLHATCTWDYSYIASCSEIIQA